MFVKLWKLFEVSRTCFEFNGGFSSSSPVTFCPRCTSALDLFYNPKYSNQYTFSNPETLIKRHRSLTVAGCTYIFRFDKPVPKDVIALTSQRLAAANNMLHCSSLLPAESAGWIPIEQARSIQVPSYRSMSCEDRNYHMIWG
jgi:hypothetical protein